MAGFDADNAGFWWQAALGGYGIPTSAALGALAAARWLARPRAEWAALADVAAASLPPWAAKNQNPTG